MTEHTADPVTQDGAGTRPEPPRLAPRPLERPEVDAEAAAVFGRPHGVDGAFASAPNGAQQSHPANGVVRPAAPPQAALVTAYGRPATDADPLQRPPGAGRAAPTAPTRRSGPRARPSTRGATPRARSASARPSTTSRRRPPSRAAPGARLSLREVLFGGRVHPRALAALGRRRAARRRGGRASSGRLTAEDASRLTSPDPKITQAVAAKERPRGLGGRPRRAAPCPPSCRWR